MSQVWKKWWTGVIALSLLLAACSSGPSASEQPNDSENAEKIRVVTTIAQIAEPISVIGGDRVEVESLMGPGVDPHLYKATQGDIQKLMNGNIVFYNGLHLEGNMTEIFEQIGKDRPVAAIAETIASEKLLTDETGQYDPHVWFDIDLWMEALNAATEELKKVSPADADYFESNKTAYFAELQALKAEATEKLAQIPAEQRVLITAHDAFGYFGRMFDIEVVGLQGLSTEDEVGISDIQSTVDLLLAHDIPAIFVESSVNQNSIQAVLEGAASAGLDVKLGGELFSDAMGDAGTEEGTYLGMYRHNVETIFQALKN
ncbi:metal ABC transporter solute-binding protein, Zn/Mn family [Brevibacillus sp. TJ4]|uniref:metal ABC transporter solute-binding protein, Zn/Mn family n=1 Tax=Brevibacillus sp. TJ4 TaxID=3234853 RepID=UPI003BA19F71